MHLNSPRHVSKHQAQYPLTEQVAQQTWAQDTELMSCFGFSLLFPFLLNIPPSPVNSYSLFSIPGRRWEV